jgi:hypothetical protein
VPRASIGWPLRLTVHGGDVLGYLDAGRFFIEEAKKREEPFVESGLPPTFISGFQTLVAHLGGRSTCG